MFDQQGRGYPPGMAGNVELGLTGFDRIETASTPATVFVYVEANNLAGAATEDHTLTMAGESTAPTEIVDTDTPEQIVDKYIAAVTATAGENVRWNASLHITDTAIPS